MDGLGGIRPEAARGLSVLKCTVGYMPHSMAPVDWRYEERAMRVKYSA